jgi:protein-L-isoaspartate(D-aspartate) O-methyltransferase
MKTRRIAIAAGFGFLVFLITACALGQDWAGKRRALVEHLAAQGITDAKVLKAMQTVQRHLFVPDIYRSESYKDHPLPIGHQQTISQPYVVAFMTQALGLKGGEKVLEIGTGSGYQAAVLGEIAKDVYSIEIVCALATTAKDILARLDYKNIHVRCGDGYKGWPDQAPFDAVIVTAAPDHIPQPLVDQLKVGGRLIIPVGKFVQELILIEKTKSGVTQKSVLPVRFVPMTGQGVHDKK